ncbi:MAG: DNA ligase [Oceanospirillaceae bacterium]|nr:DNA ligase [Oceanospirillaceae bacterium]MBT13642.1 DNA ligase [Oceanospirillaceae bacterium]|tara:strand:+ start:1813 stop:2664 length:852 start_codon:yes stop_codon:yes gene_type:complete
MDIVMIILLTLLLAGLPQSLYAAAGDAAPALMLAQVYQPGIDVEQYLVSEKLDGVRAYWDGTRLRTRSGRYIQVPQWFTHGFPDTPLDGELWAGRERFSWASGVVRRQQPVEDDWRQMRFMVFDLPAMAAPFTERYRTLKKLVNAATNSQLQLVRQRPVSSADEVEALLQQVTASGGEGLMLKRADSLYQLSRSDDLLKVKITQDDEATVVGYVPGEGKYQGQMGAVVVRMEDGREFRIGSGFSDAERQSPPALGSRITFAYNGLTKTGLPRFARFLRIRPEE